MSGARIVAALVAVVVALGVMLSILWTRARAGERASFQIAPAQATGSEPRAHAPASPAGPSTDASLAELRATIHALDERIRLLEAQPATSERRALDEAVSDEERVRRIVLDVLARKAEDDRVEGERRAREDELLELEQAEAEIRFQLEMVVRQVAEQVELLPEEQERLADVLVDYHRRQEEVTRTVDPLETDPEDFQRQLEEVREWLRRELESVLGVDVATRILEHFG